MEGQGKDRAIVNIFGGRSVFGIPHVLDTVTMNSVQKKQDGRAVVATARVPQWWAIVPAEERQVLIELMRMVRGLKHSRVPQVARAAQAWECTLGCFIKVRLMNRRPPRRFQAEPRNVKVTSCRSASHNQPGASPNPN